MNEEDNEIYIEKLKKEFNRIRDMKYVKSVNNNSSGIGLTFERLLGKETDNFPLPDYYNIELKAKLAYSTKPITLFRLVPEGKNFFELKRIVAEYGYYSNDNDYYKSLNCNVSTVTKTRIRCNYFFKLYINYNLSRLELHIFDKNGKLVDSTPYWDFDKIKNALYRKLKYLAVITTYGSVKNGERYYKYYKLTLYKLKDFSCFLCALESGFINVGFSIDIYKNGSKKGMPHDHGVCFRIFESNLYKIYNKLQ